MRYAWALLPNNIAMITTMMAHIRWLMLVSEGGREFKVAVNRIPVVRGARIAVTKLAFPWKYKCACTCSLPLAIGLIGVTELTS